MCANCVPCARIIRIRRMLPDANTAIMASVPQPPVLQLPQGFHSAPASRLHTPPPPPGRRGRRAASEPVSPLAKKVPSPIAKKVLAPVLSPTRGLQKHRFHATFSKHNPRAVVHGVSCPSHAYGSAETAINYMRNGRLRGSASFPTFNPRAFEAEATCPVHSYTSVEQELRVLPSTAVGGVKFGGTSRHLSPVRVCPVHSYTSVEQELRVLPSTAVGGVKFGNTPRRLSPARANCPVHVYAAAKSTLSRMGAASFGTERRLAAHPGASLRRVGSSTPLLPTIERAPRALPKLAPLPEVGRKPEDDEGDSSPRGVEAVLA